MRHRDLVKTDPISGLKSLMERMEPDDPRAQGPNHWKQAISGWATYIFISSPHTLEECPFSEHPGTDATSAKSASCKPKEQDTSSVPDGEQR